MKHRQDWYEDVESIKEGSRLFSKGALVDLTEGGILGIRNRT
jgi:hypothetical protein